MPVSMLPRNYNNGMRIMQSPGYVLIVLEMAHEVRINGKTDMTNAGVPGSPPLNPTSESMRIPSASPAVGCRVSLEAR
jgi:hypothetical protein